MLEALRQGAGGIIAKIFIGVLALSFAVWGISDVFTGQQTGALATIGDEKVTERQFQVAFQQQLRAMSQRFGRQLSLAQARRLGIDVQVLGQLAQRAAMDHEAKVMKLGLSDKFIAGGITRSSLFKNAQGEFDRDAFNRFLQNQNLTEAGFIVRERRNRLRNQVGSVVRNGVSAPDALARVFHLQSKETRQAAYFVLPASAATASPAPSNKDIVDYYNANKARFVAPEYRAITLLKLEPKDLIGTITVTEDDLRKAYKERQAEFVVPERRTIEQIMFKSKTDAEKAAKRLADGMDFLALAKELKHKKVDIELGNLSAKEIPDAKFAKAAFELKLNIISQPIVTPFKTVILRVIKINR